MTQTTRNVNSLNTQKVTHSFSVHAVNNEEIMVTCPYDSLNTTTAKQSAWQPISTTQPFSNEDMPQIYDAFSERIILFSAGWRGNVHVHIIINEDWNKAQNKQWATVQRF